MLSGLVGQQSASCSYHMPDGLSLSGSVCLVQHELHLMAYAIACELRLCSTLHISISLVTLALWLSWPYCTCSMGLQQCQAKGVHAPCLCIHIML